MNVTFLKRLILRSSSRQLSETNLLSASEIGILWQTYKEKTLIMRFLEYFKEKSDDD